MAGGLSPEDYLRQAYRDAAEAAGWLIEMEVFDRNEGALATAWAPREGYALGPMIRRQEVPAGAVYEHSGRPGRLWLNEHPHLMGVEISGIPFHWFRVATLLPPAPAQGQAQDVERRITAHSSNCAVARAQRARGARAKGVRSGTGRLGRFCATTGYGAIGEVSRHKYGAFGALGGTRKALE